MNQLFRLSNLVLVSGVLALVAVVWVLWPRAAAGRPVPLPVPAGDAEVAWLSQASAASSWERFVAAAEQASRDCPDLQVEIDEKTFPHQAAAFPQVAVSVRGKTGRLVFRWYKLTADWNAQAWVEALLDRRPPPLAIIGGDSSDQAIELAGELKKAGERLPEASRPLLLITTATADYASAGDPAKGPPLPLPQIYPGRTFRFCFTNRQMADAVIGFIWSRDYLRPDTDPVYTVSWADDPYSNDLTGPDGGFRAALKGPMEWSRALSVARDWGWFAGCAADGAFPANLPGSMSGQFRVDSLAPPLVIDSGVGTFDHPNRHEAEAAGHLVDEMGKHPGQRRPLLLLAAQQQQMRRFLHVVARSAPTPARRLVVATGDTISFNAVYRDREVTWPVQDLPFPLVFFAHRDPADERAGFGPKDEADPGHADEGAPANGTDTLLLYRDIVEALARSAWSGGPLAEDASRLREQLVRVAWAPGGRVVLPPDPSGDGATLPTLFDAAGNRRTGTGEHVVCLLPEVERVRVMPRARLSVWPLPAGWTPGGGWELGPSRTLSVSYQGDLEQEGEARGGN
jgi:hypothetical protein